MSKTLVSAITIAAISAFVLVGSSSAGPQFPYKPGFRPTAPTQGTKAVRIFKPKINAAMAKTLCQNKFQGINITHVVLRNGKWECHSKDFYLGTL